MTTTFMQIPHCMVAWMRTVVLMVWISSEGSPEIFLYEMGGNHWKNLVVRMIIVRTVK